MKTYKYLEKWTMPDSYMGASWYDYYSAGVGQHRDCDALLRSNFESMLKKLGGESETIIVVRESHWAVGWVEWIAIHSTDEKALNTANEIMARLEDYPIIDEDHFSETEMNEANEVWANCYNNKERLEYIREFRDQFEFYDFKDLMSCIRGEYFAGYASELLI